MMRKIRMAAAGLAMIVVAAPCWAHHAFSTEFDATRPVVFTGKVTKVELINPHSWIHVDVVNDDGTVTSWMIEGGSPNALLRRGIDRNTIPIGSELLVDGYGSRDGGSKAVGVDVKFADGTPLFLGGTQRDN
jgi:hypothetical protein